MSELPRRTVLAAAASGLPAAASGLPDRRWQARLVVLHAPRADDAALVAQQAMLDAELPALAERQVEVVRLDAAGAEAAGLSPDRFGGALIGLDGGIKLRWRAPLATERILAAIDAMPMRRR